MRKFTKKALCVFTAAAITAGALSLTACGSSFKPVTPDNSESIESNGGFVVSTEQYYYFINGVEDYASDNTYGDVVKGALMRVKKEDVKKKENNAETVIPSLMVAGDYTSGVYIFDGRIYYASPNNVKNTSGKVENEYLDFKSAKTDGSDVKTILRVKDNSTKYRFIEAGEEGNKAVYLVYVEGTELHSLNTVTGKDTVLADGGTYVFHNNQKDDPYIYYTMDVTLYLDSDTSNTKLDYNQIYRVRADATEGYEYTWNQEWLDENNEGKEPYVNLGKLVLDGIGTVDKKITVTQFNHDAEDVDLSTIKHLGYQYTLQSYENEGIYFVREEVSTKDKGLYYLPASAVEAKGWNSILGNDSQSLVKIANEPNTSNASASALFYIDEGAHKYLYVKDGYIVRATVGENGTVSEELQVAWEVGSATLVSIDTDSDAKYDYVYYTRSSGSGNSVERAVINGAEADYKNLQYEGKDNAPYKPAKILEVQHASGWYQFEILDNNLFYANAESFNNSFNYVYTVNLKNAQDKLMSNVEIEALNDKYEEIFGGEVGKEKVDGYLKEVSESVSSNYSNALKYYFYTHEDTLFWENIQDARDAGKTEKYVLKNIYTQKEQDAFKDFTTGKAEDLEKFKDGTESYFSLAYFTTRLGEMNEADTQAYSDYWKTSVLQAYIESTTEEDEGLAWWAWLLIAIAIAAVVAGVIVGLLFYLKKRKKDTAPKVERMRVDTTDDKDVDVYNTGAEETPAEEKAEAAEEPAEEPAETTEEAEAPEVEATEETVEAVPEEPAPEAAEPAGEQKEDAPAEAEQPAEAPAEEASAEAEQPAKEAPAEEKPSGEAPEQE